MCPVEIAAKSRTTKLMRLCTFACMYVSAYINYRIGHIKLDIEKERENKKREDHDGLNSGGGGGFEDLPSLQSCHHLFPSILIYRHV